MKTGDIAYGRFEWFVVTGDDLDTLMSLVKSDSLSKELRYYRPYYKNFLVRPSADHEHGFVFIGIGEGFFDGIRHLVEVNHA